MRNELLKIAKKIDSINNEESWFNSDYSQMDNFINKKLSSLFYKKYLNDLISNMDILLSYTNFTNINWVCDNRICFHKDFLNTFINNLNHFKYKQQIDQLIYYLYTSIGSEIFTNKMIDKLANYDINTSSINTIFSYMNDEQRMLFLRTLHKNKKPIRISHELNENERSFIAENIDDFIKSSNNLFLLKGVIENYPDAIKKVNDCIDSNFDYVIDSVMENISYLDKNDQNLRTFIYHLVKDVVDNEKVKYSDIKNNASGGYSSILFVGNKVIKIGKKRETPVFPNNPYIVKPLLRREIKTNTEPIFVEVTQKVKTGIKISDEVLYDLYKKMRDLGLIWTDVAPKNVGILLEDNDIHWKEDINPSDKTLNLNEKRGNSTLKVGDYVILDADFIFEENDPNITYALSSMQIVKEFEERYQQERKRL